MRNWFDTGCDCSNPEPIVGAIVGGKKFPFGTVKQSDYNADKEVTDAKLAELDDEIKSANTKHEADVALINRKINSDIESVKSQIVTGDEALNSKINANSTAINSKVDSAVAVINHSIADTDAQIKAVSASVAQFNDKLSELGGKVTAIEGKYDADILSLKSSVSNIHANIKAITDIMSNLDARVTALEHDEPQPVPPAPVDKFYVYWGSSPAAVPNAAVVAALQFNLYTDEVTRTITVPCNNEYCYYCIPKSEGQVQFEAFGIGGFENPVEIAVETTEGNSETYFVYRSTQLLDGTAPIKVKR